jgi:hypothetical protein
VEVRLDGELRGVPDTGSSGNAWDHCRMIKDLIMLRTIDMNVLCILNALPLLEMADLVAIVRDLILLSVSSLARD